MGVDESCPTANGSLSRAIGRLCYSLSWVDWNRATPCLSVVTSSKISPRFSHVPTRKIRSPTLAETSQGSCFILFGVTNLEFFNLAAASPAQSLESMDGEGTYLVWKFFVRLPQLQHPPSVGGLLCLDPASGLFLEPRGRPTGRFALFARVTFWTKAVSILKLS